MNIGGAQVCWKGFSGCTSVSFAAGQSYRAVCGVAEGYNYGSLDAFGWIHQSNETINQTYADGLSITHGSPHQHLFTYAAASTMGGCPCKGGQNSSSFAGNNFYCGDDVLPPGETWKQHGTLTPFSGMQQLVAPILIRSVVMTLAHGSVLIQLVDLLLIQLTCAPVKIRHTRMKQWDC